MFLFFHSTRKETRLDYCCQSTLLMFKRNSKKKESESRSTYRAELLETCFILLFFFRKTLKLIELIESNISLFTDLNYLKKKGLHSNHQVFAISFYTLMIKIRSEE